MIFKRFSSVSSSTKIWRRAVFDIGSGSTKLQVADVDCLTNKIVKTHFKDARQVLFVNEGKFSPTVKQEGLEKLQELKTLADNYGATHYMGVATQAFRISENGEDVLEYFHRELRFPMKIISSSDEARLGYHTAKALLVHDDKNLVAWDCGAGSFQMSYFENDHSDRFGSGTVLKVARQIKNDVDTGASWKHSEITGVLDYLYHNLIEFPDWIRNPDISCVSIGSKHSIFNQQAIFGGNDMFSAEDVEQSINECIGLNRNGLFELEQSRFARLEHRKTYNVSIENTMYIVPKLLLLYAVMKKAEISKVQYFEINGNCEALLTLPHLWDVPNSQTIGKNNALLTVNWHLEKDCNYKCSFCYAHFDHVKKNLDKGDGFKLIQALKDEGFYKINFAGGEPLMNKNLGEYVKFAKQQGLKTSIITNASLLTKTWLANFGPYLDQIGISCDSLDDKVQNRLGRGFGAHVAITRRAFQRIDEFNKQEGKNIISKLNTVVLKDNHEEDWKEFIRENKIKRWKIFKILKIEGENDDNYDDLAISDEEFRNFVDRHEVLKDEGVVIAEEDNDDMTLSYVMVTPEGHFYQNTNKNEYNYSDNILDVGVRKGMEQVGFDIVKFRRRGGSYQL